MLAGRTNASSNSNEMWVLGGDVEFSVVNSNLTNFVSDIAMTKIDGTGARRHTIEKLDNVSGMSMNGQLNNMSSMMNTNSHYKILL